MTITLFDSDIDFSFAICPRRRNRNTYIERTSFFQSEYDTAELETEEEEDDSSTSSCRSVTFAEDVVSEVISVPRYEKESKSELFYSRLDMLRFKQEARLERMGCSVIW